MNIKVLTLAATAAGVAIVTFVALNLAAPITHATEEHTQAVTAEQVFAGSIAEPGASAPAAAEPAAAPGNTATPSDSTARPSTPVPTEVASGSDAPAAEPELASSSVAVAPAIAAPTSTSGSCASAATVDPATRVVVAATAAAGQAEISADVATDAPAEKVAAAPAPQAAPKIVDAPLRKATPVPAPAPKVRTKPPMPKSAPAEVRTAWWPAKVAGKLNLVYAGEASFTKAIVLLFDGAFDSGDGADKHVRVTTQGGRKVEGKWLVATGNPKMLLFNVGPGLYRIEVGDGVKDKDGRAISAASGGLVFVP